MTRIERIALRAEDTGTIELVCERSKGGTDDLAVRSFHGRDEFGLLVDGLEPDERVTLFFEAGTAGPGDEIDA